MCARETEFKSILFALCYFHAVVCERRKFGPQGWNRIYPFNTGDLTISMNVLYNYLEANAKVPWEDLRYLFGEIMYGGHITDDWDRRLCRTYLEVYMHPDMVRAGRRTGANWHGQTEKLTHTMGKGSLGPSSMSIISISCFIMIMMVAIRSFARSLLFLWQSLSFVSPLSLKIFYFLFISVCVFIRFSKAFYDYFELRTISYVSSPFFNAIVHSSKDDMT